MRPREGGSEGDVRWGEMGDMEKWIKKENKHKNKKGTKKKGKEKDKDMQVLKTVWVARVHCVLQKEPNLFGQVCVVLLRFQEHNVTMRGCLVAQRLWDGATCCVHR